MVDISGEKYYTQAAQHAAQADPAPLAFGSLRGAA